MGHCRRCGRCCWDFKGNDPSNRCEQLADDLVTCMVYETNKNACGGLADNWPDPPHACDLPEDCGYVIFWKGEGSVV